MGLAELTQVKGERSSGAQHVSLWRDNSGDTFETAGVQSRRVSVRQGGGRRWARRTGEGNLTSRGMIVLILLPSYFTIFDCAVIS